jgi:hypothetical protein
LQKDFWRPLIVAAMETVIVPLTITRVVILSGVLFAYLPQAGAAKDLSFSSKALLCQLRTGNAPDRLQPVLRSLPRVGSQAEACAT